MKREVVFLIVLAAIIFGYGCCPFKALTGGYDNCSSEEECSKKQAAEAEIAKVDPVKALYETKCGSCHKPIPREKRDAETWAKYVQKYAKKSGLTSSQKDKILDYLIDL
jgi:nitrate/TMAO reductase-like tetraheme cytochrome c subunit